MNLIARLAYLCPRWRDLYGDDPLIAAVELGLIEQEDLDEPPLDFESERTQRAAEDLWREQMRYYETDEEDSDYEN